ncbi:MAG: dihydrofolate reductase [Candidatus Levybacteria bacterium]|nr:dihydrofolate reductase [Candidatus Levybacteria bacterium]
MKVSIIAAIGKNRELGKNNKLLWHIKEDLQRFKSLTAGHPIIMGRKTWESLPFKPLPNRANIVVTRNLDFSFARPGLAKLARSLEEAIEKAREILKQVQDDSLKEVFIIGGGQIYKEAMGKGLVDKLYLTLVDVEFDADTFFPNYSEFKKVVLQEKRESEGYKYTFLELER